MDNRIRELREQSGMTQVRLSIELEITQETVSAYEIGKHYPSVKSLMKMSELFNASMDYIMGLSRVRKPMSMSELSNDEIYMLATYRKFNELQQAKVIAYMQGLLEK